MSDPPEIPEPYDYIITDSGPLGSRLAVSGGGDEKFLGEYRSNEEAEAAIWSDMERNRIWPSVWYVDDHGGITLYDMNSQPTEE